jgi:ATP-dependent protease ClpP protease subunit
MTLTARRILMKHLILSAITAVTLLVAATTMLWSHSLFTEHQAVAMVIGQIQQIESPLQNTVEGMAKAF